jgi:hypothetical protein
MLGNFTLAVCNYIPTVGNYMTTLDNFIVVVGNFTIDVYNVPEVVGNFSNFTTFVGIHLSGIKFACSGWQCTTTTTRYF